MTKKEPKKRIKNFRFTKRRNILLLTLMIFCGVFGYIGYRILQPSDAAITYSGPITITAGGTYTGNWQSLNVDTPAVTIKTSQPVTIENSNIRASGDMIHGSAVVNLTVRNTNGYGVNPNVRDRQTGGFVAMDGGFTNFLAENNYFEKSGGIWLHNYQGNRTQTQTVKVLRNKARNIESRNSDGNGGYLNGIEDFEYYKQFLQLDKVNNVPHMEVAWNEIINEPYNSRVEDNINLYNSGGTADSRMKIHHNYIQGAYPPDPKTQPFSGGGIIAGDLSDNSWRVGYVDIYENIVLSTTNYGISIVCGENQSVYNNRIIASGVLADGSRISAMNVGLSMGSAAGWGSPCPAYVNNNATNNVLGWQRTATQRNDSWTPNCGTCTGNTSISGSITRAIEAAEYERWQGIVADAGVIIGPQGSVSPPPPPPPADTQKPTVPGNLRTTAINQTSISLAWDASTDNVGVSGYNLYRGNTKIRTQSTRTYTDSNLTAGTSYSYQISAYDAAGNESTKSSVLAVTTTATAPPPPPPTPTYRPEDINQDGVVNLLDFSILAANFGKSSGLTNPRADINGDGVVNLLDFSLLAAKFGS